MQGEVAGGDQQPMQMVLRVKHPSSLSSSEEAAGEGEGSSRSALSVFKAKEEQIERKKMEVREKVFAQLGRVEEESKRLAFIRQPRHSGAAIANARAAEIFAGHHASWADAAADLRPRLADAEQQPAAQRAHADRLEREAQERDSLLSALLTATPPDLLPDSARFLCRLGAAMPMGASGCGMLRQAPATRLSTATAQPPPPCASLRSLRRHPRLRLQGLRRHPLEHRHAGRPLPALCSPRPGNGFDVLGLAEEAG